MVKIIMHGCNGKMGQVISGLIAADPDMELVAGIDARWTQSLPCIHRYLQM